MHATLEIISKRETQNSMESYEQTYEVPHQSDGLRF